MNNAQLKRMDRFTDTLKERCTQEMACLADEIPPRLWETDFSDRDQLKVLRSQIDTCLSRFENMKKHVSDAILAGRIRDGLIRDAYEEDHYVVQ